MSLAFWTSANRRKKNYLGELWEGTTDIKAQLLGHVKRENPARNNDRQSVILKPLPSSAFWLIFSPQEWNTFRLPPAQPVPSMNNSWQSVQEQAIYCTSTITHVLVGSTHTRVEVRPQQCGGTYLLSASARERTDRISFQYQL